MDTKNNKKLDGKGSVCNSNDAKIYRDEIKSLIGDLNNISSKALKKYSFDNERILLCEDNKSNQILASKVLESLGLNVDIASNGQEGVDLFKKNEYRLVLMDMHMPIKSGVEAALEIRSISKDVPIIALTSNVSIEDAWLCKKAGMNSFFTKPLSSVLLSQEIDKWLNKPR
jgi:CheY-like chemotaxis protein